MSKTSCFAVLLLLLPTALVAKAPKEADFPKLIECAASRRIATDAGRLSEEDAGVYKPKFERKHLGPVAVVYSRVRWWSDAEGNGPTFVAYVEREGDYHVVHLVGSGTYTVNIKKGTYIAVDANSVDEDTARMMPATAAASGSLEEGRCIATW